MLGKVGKAAMVLTRRRLIVAAVIVAGIAAWVAVDRLWPTDAKRIDATLDRLKDAAGAANTDDVMAVIAPEFGDEEMGRERLEQEVRAFFRVAGATYVRYLRREINVTGQLAAAEVVVFSQTDPKMTGFGTGRSRWRLSLRKYGEEWLIIEIEPVQFEAQRVHGWRSVRYHLGG